MRASGWLLLSLLLTLPGYGAPTPDALMKSIRARHEKIKTLHCKLKATVNISLVGVGVDGDLYYQTPDKLKVELDQLPGVLRGHKNSFASAVPQGKQLTDYAARITGEATLNGIKCWTVVLVPKAGKANNVSRLDVWVDKKELVFPRAIIQYKDGTVITQDTEHTKVDGHTLPDTTELKFKFPRFAASADVLYIDYEVNQPLPAGIFTDKKMP